MDQATLNAELRKEAGSIAARRFRRAGQIPAVLYGHTEDPVSLLLRREDVQHLVAHRVKMIVVSVKGKAESALVKDVQFDTFGEEVLHLDLERVAMDEVIEVECPVELTGTSKGAAAGGVVEHPVSDLRIQCLPGNIPEVIKVSTSDLAIGDAIHVRDIQAPEGVTILTDPEAILVTIRPPVVVVEEEALAEEAKEPGAEEPEVIGREKAEGEEDKIPEGSG